MAHKKSTSTLIAFKVDREMAKLLESLPNKSEFIRTAVEARLGHVCPLCRGSGLAQPGAQDDLNKLVALHPSVRCDSCGVLEPRPCHPADAETHGHACEDTRTHNYEDFGTYFCANCFANTAACTSCGRHFIGEKRAKTCDVCRAARTGLAG